MHCSLMLLAVLALTPRLAAQQRPAPPPVIPWRSSADCVGVVPPAEPTDSTPDYHSARGFLILPPLPRPRQMRGTTLTVRMLYRANGRVDSIQVLGAADSAYAARYLESIRAAASRRTVHPAVYQGCAVDSWWTVKMTFDP